MERTKTRIFCLNTLMAAGTIIMISFILISFGAVLLAFKIWGPGGWTPRKEIAFYKGDKGVIANGKNSHRLEFETSSGKPLVVTGKMAEEMLDSYNNLKRKYPLGTGWFVTFSYKKVMVYDGDGKPIGFCYKVKSWKTEDPKLVIFRPNP